MSVASLRDFFHDVALAVFPPAVPDRVLRILARPQTKSIMMFCSQNQALHAGHPGGRDNLIGIKSGRVEQLVSLIPVSPLLVGKGIDGEMEKPVELHLMPPKLARRR